MVVVPVPRQIQIHIHGWTDKSTSLLIESLRPLKAHFELHRNFLFYGYEKSPSTDCCTLSSQRSIEGDHHFANKKIYDYFISIARLAFQPSRLLRAGNSCCGRLRHVRIADVHEADELFSLIKLKRRLHLRMIRRSARAPYCA